MLAGPDTFPAHPLATSVHTFPAHPPVVTVGGGGCAGSRWPRSVIAAGAKRSGSSTRTSCRCSAFNASPTSLGVTCASSSRTSRGSVTRRSWLIAPWVLCRMFNFALDREWIEANPASRIPEPGEEQSRDRVLTHEDLRELCATIRLPRKSGRGGERRQSAGAPSCEGTGDARDGAGVSSAAADGAAAR